MKLIYNVSILVTGTIEVDPEHNTMRFLDVPGNNGTSQVHGTRHIQGLPEDTSKWPQGLEAMGVAAYITTLGKAQEAMIATAKQMGMAEIEKVKMPSNPDEVN